MVYKDFMKLHSNWDFIKQQDKVDFKYMCRFELPADVDIETLRKSSLKWAWSDIENSDTSEDIGPLERALNTRRLAESITNDTGYTIKRSNPVRTEWMHSIINQIGFTECNIRFLSQEPNTLTNWHIDSFYGKDLSGKVYSLKQTDKCVQRFMVMLTEWDFGQVMMFGNSVFTHWKIGDCITWDAINMPHSTANTGWSERSSIIITGFATAESTKFENKI